jgi:hypothetical protein
MCCGPYDYDYPSIGGKHQRADQSYGRVGSLFSDPYASPEGGTADSNLKPPKPKGNRGLDDDSNEAQELRDRLNKELEERKKSEPQSSPSPDDSKEAFRRYQRPQAVGEWR